MKSGPSRSVALAVLFCLPLASYAINVVNPMSDYYIFGIVPQQSGSKLSKKWTPILLYLEEKTGYKFRFATTRNIPTFEKRLASGKYDFSYMNPYQYTQYHDVTGYRAMAKAKDKRLKGIVVVHKNSSFKRIQDLDDEKLAFPSHAFAANLVPRAVFSNQGIDFTPKYVASHDSVYRNVARGRVAAGGGVMRTFNATSAEYRDQIRVLWKTDGYTPHPFTSHPRVPRDVVERVQQALLQMENDPAGKKLLKNIGLKGIEPGRDSDWDDVRALNIHDGT